MPSEYTTPVLDYISLATEQTTQQQQFRDHQQQQLQQQHQASSSTMSMMVPMSLSSIPMSPPTSSNLNSAQSQSSSPPPPLPLSPLSPAPPLQTTQTKMCPVCHCALIPENSDIVNVQGVPNIACAACIASELLLLRQQQRHRRQFEELEESLMNHLVSDTTASSSPPPMVPVSAAQAHSSSSPPQSPPTQFLSAISTPNLSSLQNRTSIVNMSTAAPTATAVESQLHVAPLSLSLSQPVGDKEKEKDDDRRDNMVMVMARIQDTNDEMENDGGMKLDDDDEQVVRDSLGLGHLRSRNTTELDSAFVSGSGANTGMSEKDLPSSSSLLTPPPLSSSPSSSSSALSQPQQVSLSRALFVSSPSASPEAPVEEAETSMATVTATEPIAHVTPRSSSPTPTPTSPSSMSSPKPPSILFSSSSSSSSPSSSKTKPNHKYLDPDPLTDISRLRARCHTHDCLYPGAQFCGTQKSGRSSYDVSVTIVDVDFQSSFLCGYLRIRGLTDDWPELTTYFDAQIIGSRYGFLTQDWGASETEDSTHWGRFPAYDRVKPLMWGPKMNIPDGASLGAVGSEQSPSPSSVAGSRSSPAFGAPGNNGQGGCVFMRWKERFLVPDHRVRDINGASFAGFYYVCVEFNPARSNVSLKRRRRKVDKRSSGGPTTRDMNVATTMRTEDSQQIRDQLNSPSNLNPTLQANAKPPDTDVEMEELLDDRRERVFEGVDIEMDMDMEDMNTTHMTTTTDGRLMREAVTTPPSRSRSLIRGTTTVHANHQSQSHSRSRTRRRRRREEQQYDRYRLTAMQNAALGNNNNNNNTATPVAVPMSMPLMSSNPVSSSPRPTSTSRRDESLYSQSLPLPTPVSMMMNTADDNCDDPSMSYREWERITVRERERERGRERGRMAERERPSRSGTQAHVQDVRPSPSPQLPLTPPPSSTFPRIPSFQHLPTPTPSQTVVQVQTHTQTVVEPESEDSESDYEYEYEYDESVYSDDPAFDDTLGSTPGGPYTATMSGYYFHQHSEPYQQLSLRYVPRRSSGSFEFR